MLNVRMFAAFHEENISLEKKKKSIFLIGISGIELWDGSYKKTVKILMVNRKLKEKKKWLQSIFGVNIIYIHVLRTETRVCACTNAHIFEKFWF